MVSSAPDARPLGYWLHDTAGPLARLLRQAAVYAAATAQLHAQLATPWAGTLRVATLRGTTLVLYTTSAAVLIPLRAHQSAILDLVQPILGLRPTRIEAKVRPKPSKAGV
jgi:hypothetical protein